MIGYCKIWLSGYCKIWFEGMSRGMQGRCSCLAHKTRQLQKVGIWATWATLPPPPDHLSIWATWAQSRRLDTFKFEPFDQRKYSKAFIQFRPCEGYIDLKGQWTVERFCPGYFEVLLLEKIN